MVNRSIASVKLVKDDGCVGDDYYLVVYSNGDKKEFTASVLSEFSKAYLDSFCSQKK
ncbi:MAG: hypothetical protein NTY33_02645 [Candidatus Moranbacteria bacterium]|nr:hypothetical protein [Candidatus Moranbacteria bacterium]